MLVLYTLYIWVAVNSINPTVKYTKHNGIISKTSISYSNKSSVMVLAQDYYTEDACEKEAQKIKAKGDYDILNAFCVKTEIPIK